MRLSDKLSEILVRSMVPIGSGIVPHFSEPQPSLPCTGITDACTPTYKPKTVQTVQTV